MQNNNLPIPSLAQSFTNNLFGVIAGGATQAFGYADFAPTDSNGNIVRLTGQDAAQWLGLKNRMMQRWAYDYCFPLAAVIDRLAEYDIAGYLEIKRAKGKGAGNDLNSDWAQRITTLFENPNPLQTWQQFRAQQVAFKRTYGFCPVLPIRPSGLGPEYAVSLHNIPPWAIEVDATGNYTGQLITEFVSAFRINVLGKYMVVDPEDIIILKDGLVQDELQKYVLPKSKLVGLDMAVSNLCAAMEADNTLLRKRGSIGFISHDTAASKDSIAGALPMTKPQQRRLEKEFYAKYGVGWNQFQYVISRVPAKWNSMVFDVKQLGTKDTIIASEKAICHRFGFPYTLYEQQDATYANAGNAAKSVYQDNVIPANQNDMAEYAKFFGAAENNAQLITCYDDVAAFQEDRKYKADADYAQRQALQIDWLNNMITQNQWREACGYETTADGDKYYKDLNSEENGNTIQQTAEEAANGKQTNKNGHKRFIVGERFAATV